jgi:hypothetical protein
MVEAKLAGLVYRAADADQQWEEAEQQCAAQVEELTLLQIRGSELFLAIVAPPKWGPCLRGCRLLLPAILRWPGSLPLYGWQCLPLLNLYLGAHPVRPSRRMLWGYAHQVPGAGGAEVVPRELWHEGL